MKMLLYRFGVLSTRYPITAALAIGAPMLFGGAMLIVWSK